MRLNSETYTEEVTGPALDEVRDYEIVTIAAAEEYADRDPHPSAETIREFGVEVASKQSGLSSERYIRGLKPLIAWLDLQKGIKDPLDASKRDVKQYIQWMTKTQWSKNSRKTRFTALQRFYGWAESEGHAENLTEDETITDYTLESGSLGDSRGETDTDVDSHKWIPREEVVQLWSENNITSPRARDELILKLMWYTTCRPRAVAEMRIEPEDSPGSEPTWLDRERGRIKVPNLKAGDNQADYRWVYYPRDRIEPLMQQWVDDRRSTLGPYAGESKYLFLTHQAPQMRPGHISRKVKQAGFNAKLQEVTGYDARGLQRWKITGKTIRHSAITYLANETDIPLHFIQQQAGHSQIDTTMQYIHRDEESRRRALNAAWK